MKGPNGVSRPYYINIISYAIHKVTASDKQMYVL